MSPLLPPDLLGSEWFRLFAAFVGVNTIIYVGLTLSKLFPWPRPAHPRHIRAALRQPEGSELSVHPLIPAVSARSVARTGIFDIARAFGWLGAIVALTGIVELVTPRDQVAGAIVTVFGLTFIALAQVLARRGFSPAAASWIWAGSISLLAVFASLRASLGATERIGFALVLSVLLGAMALTWPSFLTAAAILLAAFARIGLDLTTAVGPYWLVPLGAALLAGAMLMILRRRTLDTLAQVEALGTQLGTTDLLTGILTREGLRTLTPGLRSVAGSAGAPVFAVRVRILNLDEDARAYGGAYRDDLLRGTADVIRGVAADGDLIGRWDDDFLILGIGEEERGRAVEDGLSAAAAVAPVSLGKRPLELGTTLAWGSAERSVDELAAATHS